MEGGVERRGARLALDASLGLGFGLGGDFGTSVGDLGVHVFHVGVWRLIFLKLSLPRDGVRGFASRTPSEHAIHSSRMAST